MVEIGPGQGKTRRKPRGDLEETRRRPGRGQNLGFCITDGANELPVQPDPRPGAGGWGRSLLSARNPRWLT